MTIVVVTCETNRCGDVRVGVADLALVLPHAGGPTYAFCCPVCHRITVRSAPPAEVKVLRNANVRIVHLERSRELEEFHDGPPFSEDDVDRLRSAVADPHWFERLAET